MRIEEMEREEELTEGYNQEPTLAEPLAMLPSKPMLAVCTHPKMKVITKQNCHNPRPTLFILFKFWGKENKVI